MKTHSQSTMWSLAWIWLVVLFCNVVQAAAPDWQVVNYPIYTGVWARVKINGVSIRSAGSKLAAFYGDELRGVAVICGTAPEDDIDGEYYFNLQFGANDASEKGFHFKLWNSADDKIYDLDKTLDFDSNYPQKPEIYGGSIGGHFAPCIMNVVMPYTITVMNGIADKSEAFEGETVTITSNDPPAGKLFDKWTSDDVVIQNETASITTFTMPAKNVTVTATYTNVQYNITVSNGTAKVNNTAVTKAAAGATVTVTANTPAAGKRFSTWTSNDVTFANAASSTTTFTMPAKNVTVTANYIDDLPVVSVAATDATATEPTTDTTASDKGAFRISRTGSTTNALTVYFSVGGTATSGTDYTAIGTSATIPAGSDHVDVTVTPKYDTASDSNETVVLTLTSKTTYTLGSPSTATVTIVNTPIYTIAAANGTANPSVAAAGATVTITANAPATGKVFDKWTSNDVTFANATSSTTTFTMPAKNVTVTATYTNVQYNITVSNGTAKVNNTAVTKAAAGATVTVTANTPAAGKRFSTWTSNDVTFANAASSTTTFTMPAKNVTVTANYIDDLPVVSVAATDATATEPTTNTTASDKGTFRISRTGSTTNALTVYFSVAGTATSGTDYTAIGTSATISAGSDHVDVTVTPKYDTTGESDETVVLTLSSKTTYMLDDLAKTAIVTIKDNDPYHDITVIGGTADKIRAKADEIVTITANLPTNKGLKIWNTDDNVEFVGSILAATTTFTMPAHDVTITASFIDKSKMPAVSVRSTTNAGDDTAMEPSSATASADKGKFTFTRTMPTGLTGALTVYFDIRGTAVNGTDYKNIASNVTFAANSTSVAVEIEPLFDGITDEPIETVEVVLEPESGTQTYRGGTYTDASVTIEEPVPAYVTYTLSASDGSDIVAAGAQWKIDDGDWNDSGVTVRTTVGSHAVYFKDVTGYTTPGSQTITLATGETNGTAIYVPGKNKYTLTVEGGKINKNGTMVPSAQFTPGEMVTITASLPSNQGLKIWTPSKDVEFVGSRLAATTTIKMPDYDVTVAASFVVKSTMPAVSVRSTTNTGDDTAKEPESPTAPADKGKFTFTRTEVNKAKALTVYYSIRGTAVNGTDYRTIVSSVTFAANSTSVAVDIEPLFDGITEPVETVEVVLEPESGTQTYRGGTYTDASIEIESIDPIMHAITVFNGTAKVDNKVVTQAAEGTMVTITANAPAAGETFKNWTSSDVAIQNALSSTTTFTMPAKSVTVTANYKSGLDPYHPADCKTKDYFISGLEYLQYAGPVKAAALGNCEYTWDGVDLLSFAPKNTHGGGSPQTRGGDEFFIMREVSSTMYMAGSIMEVTLTFNGTERMVALFIGERIPEGWTVVGDAADFVVDGVLRKTWNKFEEDPDGPSIPETFTYVIQAPAANLAASYVITGDSDDTGCFAEDGIHAILVDDTILTNNYHPADSITKDGKISGIEYLRYAGPVMLAAIENFEYTWDEPDIFSLRRKNATRGGAAADVAIARSVDTTTYVSNGQIIVTLAITGADGIVSLFIGERIPEGWSVIGNHADNVRNGVFRMAWDAPNIPDSVTYTLQATADNLPAACKIASSTADTGCFTDHVLFLDAGETILTHGSAEKPAEWPEDMTLYAPADGRNFREADNLAITFSWPAIHNAEGYRLIVAAYDGTVVFDETLEETSCAVRGLEQGSFLWNVTAIGDGCIAGTSDDFRFAVVPAVSAPIIIGAVADGTTIRLAFDKAEPGYTDSEITYQVIFYSLETQTLTNLTQTVTVADGKAVIDLGVAASNGYLVIRPVTTPESNFTELYIK